MKQMIRHSLALAAFGTVAAPIIAGPALAEPAPGASAWEIGPVIRGRNYSVNMPLRPAPTRDGFAFDFPGPERADGHVHYVTFDPGSLEGATKIRFTYRIDAAPGVRFVPQEAPTRPATIALSSSAAETIGEPRANTNITAGSRPATACRIFGPARTP